MADESMDSGADTGSTDIAVDIETLSIDGKRPAVGDMVEVRVGGPLSKIVNGTAFVTPQTVNDAPMPPPEEASEGEDLRAAAMEADQSF